MEMETRVLPGAVEVRKTGDSMTLAGTGIQWGVLSADLGGFREKFAPNSITLDDDSRVVWQHDGRYVFGRQGAGTARFTMDESGAHYEADPPKAQWADDAVESIRRRDVYQNSFKFSVKEGGESWGRDSDGVMIRTVTSAHIYEMGPQTEPAYPTTTVAMRSLQAAIEAEARQKTPVPGAGVVDQLKATDRPID